MTYGIAIYRDNSYEVYEKPAHPKYTSQLIRKLENDERGFKNLVVCKDYKSKGYDGPVIPYKEWAESEN